jgi:hypothetical protein
MSFLLWLYRLAATTLINIHAAAPPLLVANLAALFFFMLLIIMAVFMQVAAGFL